MIIETELTVEMIDTICLARNYQSEIIDPNNEEETILNPITKDEYALKQFTQFFDSWYRGLFHRIHDIKAQIAIKEDNNKFKGVIIKIK